jgi:hypothetical protein
VEIILPISSAKSALARLLAHIFAGKQFAVQLVSHAGNDKGETNMSDKTIDKAPIDLSHPSIGGRKVGHWVPVNEGKEIDFSSIPGVRCVLPPPKRAETSPAEPVEKEDEDVHTD